MKLNRGRLIELLRRYPKAIWLLGIGSFLNVFGLSFLWPVNAIYIHGVLHQSMTTAGLVLMLYSGSGFVGSFLGGLLYDRFGALPVLVLSIAISIGVIIVPAFTANWFVYIVVMALFGVTCAMPFPILNAFGGHVWPDGGRRVFNFLYVANNLGVALGTALGGLLAGISFSSVFIAIAIGYTLFLCFVWFGLRRQAHAMHQAKREERTAPELSASARIPWGLIGILLLGFIVAWSVYVQWQSTVSVDMQSLGYPLAAYSLLWTMNGLLIFLCQPLVAQVVRRLPKLPYQMCLGTVLFAVSFGLLLLSHHYVWFVVAMVLTSFGEMFAWPSVPAAVAQLSPQNRLGMLQGLVSSGATFGRMLGPLWGGMLYDRGGIHSVLFASLLTLLVPLVLFILFHLLTRGSEMRGVHSEV